MFPTRELLASAERLLERDRVHQLLIDARPELEDRIEIDDAKPLLTIPTGRGGAIILWNSKHEGTIRWRMAVPGGDGVTVLEPNSIEDLPGLVAGRLGASA